MYEPEPTQPRTPAEPNEPGQAAGLPGGHWTFGSPQDPTVPGRPGAQADTPAPTAPFTQLSQDGPAPDPTSPYPVPGAPAPPAGPSPSWAPGEAYPGGPTGAPPPPAGPSVSWAPGEAYPGGPTGAPAPPLGPSASWAPGEPHPPTAPLSGAPGAAFAGYPGYPGTTPFSYPGTGGPLDPGGTGGGPAAEGHRGRGLLVAGAAGAMALALVAGVGIGHAAWPVTTTVSPAASGSSGSSGSGSSGFGSTTPSFGGGSGSSPSFGGSSGSSGSSGSGSTSNASGGPSDVSSIASKVDPGLVDINVTLGYDDEEGAGTGMVLTSNGEVLTNNHVVNGVTSISVTDVGNGKTYGATVVGYDRSADVAVIQLKDASGLQTISADQHSASVGEGVVAIGNAGGAGGTPSAAGGSVTDLGQSITASDEADGSSEQLSGLIETNADVQPGDSGGTLVNSSGQVVGMDTAASEGFSFSQQGNTGYAIPIATALKLAGQIEAGDASSSVHVGPTAFLGVSVTDGGGQSSSSSGGGYSYSFGYPGYSSGGSTSDTPGALIEGVVSGQAADKAGLVAGDTITSLNAKTVASADDLTTLMFGLHPGDTVTIGYVDQSGQSHSVKVTLGSGPAS